MSSKKMIEKRRLAKKQQKRNRTIAIVGILIAVFAGVSLAVFSGQAPTAALPMEVSVDEAYQMQEDGAFVLDVREQYEWDEKHIPGATLIPLGELAARVDELPRDQEIVVVCRSGNRSQDGRDILLQAGFEQVTSMAGGINQWIESGYEAIFGQ
jgi:rhodanese-related sulfurtransferase